MKPEQNNLLIVAIVAVVAIVALLMYAKGTGQAIDTGLPPISGSPREVGSGDGGFGGAKEECGSRSEACGEVAAASCARRGGTCTRICFTGSCSQLGCTTSCS